MSAKAELTGRHALQLALGTAAGSVPVGVGFALRAGRWWLVLAVPGFAFCTVYCCAMWWMVLNDRQLLWTAERGLRMDLNKDSYIGKPQKQEPQLVYVHGAKRPANADFRAFLSGVYDGTVSWRDWKGTELPSGMQIQQEQWQDWCDMLIRAGLAERPYPTAPLELTSSFRDALVAFSELL